MKFFHKLRKRLLSENKLSKYLLYAAGEIFLVVVGILIALQINNWNQAKATQQLNYQLVFLTAYEHYALQAFDTNAIDYLVKPARPELIAKSIRKILRQAVYVSSQNLTPKDDNRLVLNDYNLQRIIEHEHINYIEGIGRYRRVHLTEAGIKLHNVDTLLSDTTLDCFCEQLPADVFYRLHRSYIINSSRLLELKLQSRRHFVRLAGTSTLIPVSRSFLSTLKQRINSMNVGHDSSPDIET